MLFYWNCFIGYENRRATKIVIYTIVLRLLCYLCGWIQLREGHVAIPATWLPGAPADTSAALDSSTTALGGCGSHAVGPKYLEEICKQTKY